MITEITKKEMMDLMSRYDDELILNVYAYRCFGDYFADDVDPVNYEELPAVQRELKDIMLLSDAELEARVINFAKAKLDQVLAWGWDDITGTLEVLANDLGAWDYAQAQMQEIEATANYHYNNR